MALLTYLTYNATDFDHMDALYVQPGVAVPPPSYTNHAVCWSSYDYNGNAGFSKPNVTEAHPTENTFVGRVAALYATDDQCAVALQLEFAPESYTVYGAPQVAWLQVQIHAGQRGGAKLEMNLQVFNKTATRLPECLMFSFEPPQSTQVRQAAACVVV